MTSNKPTPTVEAPIGSPLDIDQDYIRAKIAEAHVLRAQMLAAMVRSLFTRRPATRPSAPIGAVRSA